MSRITEYSEDRRRGEMRHIAEAIQALRVMPGHGVKCGRCTRAQATHLVDAQLVVCESCATEWKRMSPQQRVEMRGRGRS